MFIYQTTLRDLYYKKAVNMYYQEGLSVRRIEIIMPVSKTAIGRWIANFAENNPEVPPMRSKSVKIETVKHQ